MIVKIAVENRIIQTGSAAPMPMFKAMDTQPKRTTGKVCLWL